MVIVNRCGILANINNRCFGVLIVRSLVHVEGHFKCFWFVNRDNGEVAVVYPTISVRHILFAELNILNKHTTLGDKLRVGCIVVGATDIEAL